MTFQARHFYKFTVYGKPCMVLATSVLNAMDQLDKQGFKSYAYCGKIG